MTIDKRRDFLLRFAALALTGVGTAASAAEPATNSVIIENHGSGSVNRTAETNAVYGPPPGHESNQAETTVGKIGGGGVQIQAHTNIIYGPPPPVLPSVVIEPQAAPTTVGK